MVDVHTVVPVYLAKNHRGVASFTVGLLLKL